MPNGAASALRGAFASVSERSRRRLVLVGLFAAIAGALVVLWGLRSMLPRLIQQQQAALSISAAQPLPIDAGAALEGGLFTAQTASSAAFYVSEPTLPAARRARILVEITSGRAVDALGALAARARAAGIVLVAPEAVRAADGALDAAATLTAMRQTIEIVLNRYDENPAALTLFGTGPGAELAARYVLAHPHDMALVSLANGRSYPQPQPGSRAWFIVMAGGQDEAARQAALAYSATLQSFRLSVERVGIIADAGSGELPAHIDATFEALAALSP